MLQETVSSCQPGLTNLAHLPLHPLPPLAPLNSHVTLKRSDGHTLELLRKDHGLSRPTKAASSPPPLDTSLSPNNMICNPTSPSFGTALL
jgi:hypothetical protein